MSASPLFDTRLMVEAPSLTVDVSQHEEDLTSASSAAFELDSARTALTGAGTGRTIEVIVEHQSGDGGIVIDHGSPEGVQAYRIGIDHDEVRVSAGGSTLVSLAIPLVELSPLPLLIHWATEPNPATTGASDALRSELLLFDFGNETLARATFTHAELPASTEGTLTIGGLWTGSLTQAWSGTIEAVRIGVTFGTAVRAREHWYVQSGAPSATDDVVRVEPRHPPEQLAEHEWISGPLLVAAAVSIEQASHRLVSHAGQAIFSNFVTMRAGLTTYPSHWVATDANGWSRCIAWLWHRRLSPHCTHLRPTIQLAMWSATLDEPSELEVRAVTSNRRPGWPADDDLEISAVVLTRQVDDGPSEKLGDLLELPPLPVHRDVQGYTWRWLEFRVNGGDEDTHTRWSIREVSWLATTIDDGDDLEFFGP